MGDGCESVAVLCGERDVCGCEVGDGLREGDVNREAADVCVYVVCDVCVYHVFAYVFRLAMACGLATVAVILRLSRS